MADRYLALIPEHGGQSFGPFVGGTICIGTDAHACQISLGGAAGVRPIHAQITFMPDGRAFLETGDRLATLWLFKQGQGQGAHVDATEHLRVGDAIALGAATGPRFILADLPPVRRPVQSVPLPPSATGAIRMGTSATEGFRREKPGAIQGAANDAASSISNARTFAKRSPVMAIVVLLGVMALFAGTCAGLVGGLIAWLTVAAGA